MAIFRLPFMVIAGACGLTTAPNLQGLVRAVAAVGGAAGAISEDFLHRRRHLWRAVHWPEDVHVRCTGHLPPRCL